MTEKIKLTSDELRLISLFSSITSATARDCIVDEKMDRVIFVVNKGQMGLAIGRGGATIKQLQNMVPRRIELVEYSDNVDEFLKNILNSTMNLFLILDYQYLVFIVLAFFYISDQ